MKIQHTRMNWLHVIGIDKRKYGREETRVNGERGDEWMLGFVSVFNLMVTMMLLMRLLCHQIVVSLIVSHIRPKIKDMATWYGNHIALAGTLTVGNYHLGPTQISNWSNHNNHYDDIVSLSYFLTLILKRKKLTMNIFFSMKTKTSL